MSLDRVDLLNPVNAFDPLTAGLSMWLYGLPQISGGGRWFDIAGRTGGGTLTSGAQWDAGAVLLRAASSQYVSTDSPQPTGTNAAVSVAAWCQSLTAATSQVVAAHAFDGSSVRWSLGTSGGSGPATAGFGFFDGGWRWVSRGLDPRGDGKWHLLGGSYDGSRLQAWTDGYLDGETTYAGGLPATTRVLEIGRYSGSEYFDGKILSFAVWNRALSAAEWREWYEQSLRGYPRALNRIRSRRYVDLGTSPPPPPPPTAVFLPIAGLGW